jgi:hypothetical protein
MSSKPRNGEQHNGALLTLSTILQMVLASAAEAEMGALFLNVKEGVNIRSILVEMGHPQPATPLQTYNTTSHTYRGSWMPYQKVWFTSCYKVPEESRFPIRLPKDKKGKVLVSEKDKTICLGARAGGHAFCQFQCELYQFINLHGRSPLFGSSSINDSET